jgi:hypothetical protein
LPAEEGVGLDVRGLSYAEETGVVDKCKFAMVMEIVIDTQTN